MPRLEFSERFADDLAAVTSAKVETRVLRALDSIEAFGAYGSPLVRETIVQRIGEGVRKVAIPPFDLVYTLDPDEQVARIEALVPARAVR